MGALEDQLRKGGSVTSTDSDDGKKASSAAPSLGKFDTLIQAQARELSHLRQRLREGRGVCSILTQHLGDTTKAFEELLRATDIDYYMGQSFREQLAQSTSLAQRVAAKLSARDHPEHPDDKTELLAIRLSKELQQKDKVIESLRAKLDEQQSQRYPNHRSGTPCSSHALSDTSTGSDQSDRISYVSDERGSTNEDLELSSELDATSEFGQEGRGTSNRSSTGTITLHRYVYYTQVCVLYTGIFTIHNIRCTGTFTLHRYIHYTQYTIHRYVYYTQVHLLYTSIFTLHRYINFTQVYTIHWYAYYIQVC